jgi:hypothetical protein
MTPASDDAEESVNRGRGGAAGRVGGSHAHPHRVALVGAAQRVGRASSAARTEIGRVRRPRPVSPIVFGVAVVA